MRWNVPADKPNFVSILFAFTISNASSKFGLLYSNIYTIVHVEVSSESEGPSLGLEQHDHLQYKLHFFSMSGDKWDIATQISISNSHIGRSVQYYQY